MKPWFVTVEGIDGTGKTTLVKKLGELLKKAGHQVLLTKEPSTHDAFSQCLTQAWLANYQTLNPVTQTMLLSAMRVHHAEKVIAPHLKKGGIVLSDRYIDSTYAYQHAGLGVDRSLVELLEAYAPKPDLTLLLIWPDFDTQEIQALWQSRLQKRGKKNFDTMDVPFFRCVQEGFLARMREDLNRFLALDASLSPHEMASDAYNRIQSLWEADPS